jgi:hypothetical protein
VNVPRIGLAVDETDVRVVAGRQRAGNASGYVRRAWTNGGSGPMSPGLKPPDGNAHKPSGGHGVLVAKNVNAMVWMAVFGDCAPTSACQFRGVPPHSARRPRFRPAVTAEW